MRSLHSIFSRCISKLIVRLKHVHATRSTTSSGWVEGEHTVSPDRHHANGMISMKILFNLLVAIVNIGVLDVRLNSILQKLIVRLIGVCVCVCVAKTTRSRVHYLHHLSIQRNNYNILFALTFHLQCDSVRFSGQCVACSIVILSQQIPTGMGQLRP